MVNPMNNVINLNQFRKQKARAEKRAKADENAVQHGRSKADKALDTARAEKSRQDHEAHKRDDE
ncbi:protein of unknown function [Roseovarius pacificus]|uniref:DUF4169 domain-containing protein n=2 Tax=Roseobacteraceae TaxID=2854170 RepID=A0A1M6XAD8_9RHOB|nr:hypothetical protein GCM10011315_07750 [Roseovarius pacificus]SHL02849.1 protein of unknown function [Roseovarius pacificus]